MLWTHGWWCLLLLIGSAALFGYWLREWLSERDSNSASHDAPNPLESDVKDILTRLAHRDQSLSNIEELLRRSEHPPAPPSESELGALRERISTMQEARALLESRLEASQASLESRDESLRLLREEYEAALKSHAETSEIQQELLTQRSDELAKRDDELAARDTGIRARDAELEERIRELTRNRELLAEQRLETERLRAQLAERDDELAKHRTELVWHQGEVEKLHGELVGYENESAKQTHELSKFADQLAARDTEVAKLRDQLQSAQSELAALRIDLGSAGIAHEELRALHEAHRALEATLTLEKLAREDERRRAREDALRLEAKLVELETKSEPRRAASDELRSTTTELATKPELLDDEPSARPTSIDLPRTRGLVLPSRPDEIDDLKAIHGVGPKLERLLHRIGIYTFKQVASWSDDDIEHVDSLLEDFHGRIRRDDWVASAHSEHRKKYGEDL